MRTRSGEIVAGYLSGSEQVYKERIRPGPFPIIKEKSRYLPRHSYCVFWLARCSPSKSHLPSQSSTDVIVCQIALQTVYRSVRGRYLPQCSYCVPSFPKQDRHGCLSNILFFVSIFTYFESLPAYSFRKSLLFFLHFPIRT